MKTNNPYGRNEPNSLGICLIILLVLIMSIFFYCGVCRAGEYSNTQIVNAIFVIEGGHKAQYAYGIRSVKYSDIAEARRICFNSVRNNRKRFIKQNEYSDFLEFLQSRYCPTKGKLSRAEQRLNGYWLRNLRKQLARAK